MKELVKQLVEAYGPSGQEQVVRGIIARLIAGHADEVRTDQMGNLIALKRGTGGGKRIMVAAHMDEIGLIVTHVDKNGFLRFGRVGGVFAPAVVGGRVQFANGAQGVIGWEKWLHSQDMPKWEEMFIDVGATSAGDAPVGIGDMAGMVRPMAEMGTRWVAKSMDDRIGCAVGVQALLEMGPTPNDVYFVFTVQEEVGIRGAIVSAYGVEPDLGLALDVTDTGDTPESHPMAVALGKGPAVKVMDSYLLAHPGVKDWMVRTAKAAGIPYQLEVLERGGTDAAGIQRARAGVPAGCLSIPCRYIHTPSEMVESADVLNAVRLLVALVTGPVEI
ncbi:MAG: M42 family metallopeptidase [Chloroflexota bacterium]